jgi:hypothetical protein
MRLSRCHLVTGSVPSLTGARRYNDPCRAGLTGASQANYQFGGSGQRNSCSRSIYTEAVMDDGLRVVTEMHQTLWDQFRGSFDDLTEDELHWRVLPQANSINVIVRHLCIESEWHLRSLQSGEPMPTIAAPVSQQAIDAVPFDFAENLNTLQRLYTAFCDILGTQSLGTLKEKSGAAYGEAATGKGLAHVLAYHQATHLAYHTGQIRSIRNLYRKTRGEPAQFFPDNPTFPRGQE